MIIYLIISNLVLDEVKQYSVSISVLPHSIYNLLNNSRYFYIRIFVAFKIDLWSYPTLYKHINTLYKARFSQPLLVFFSISLFLSLLVSPFRFFFHLIFLLARHQSTTSYSLTKRWRMSFYKWHTRNACRIENTVAAVSNLGQLWSYRCYE